MKIGFLIPCTSTNRNWNSIKQSYFYNLTLKTLLLTQDKEHEYHFYIGIDKDDKIFNNKTEQQILLDYNKVFKNVHFQFIVFDNIEKGYLTKMWNQLFNKAYYDKCDYYYQCGDDINFRTKGWVNDCIKMLQKNNNIGLTGPINNNNYILTQAFVSNKHMDIFGYFFPENIINWGCDDWYNYVYKPNYFFPLTNHYCSNEGGEPRYIIDKNIGFRANYTENVSKLREKTQKQGVIDREKIQNYLKK
jgi:hypothetical protein